VTINDVKTMLGRGGMMKKDNNKASFMRRVGVACICVICVFAFMACGNQPSEENDVELPVSQQTDQTDVETDVEINVEIDEAYAPDTDTTTPAISTEPTTEDSIIPDSSAADALTGTTEEAINNTTSDGITADQTTTESATTTGSGVSGTTGDAIADPEVTGEAIDSTTSDGITADQTTTEGAVATGSGVSGTTGDAIADSKVTGEAIGNTTPDGITETTEPKVELPPLVSAYNYLYPDMHVAPPTEKNIYKKTLFMTFDDGPSANTISVLDTLKAHDIKATFFVVGSKINDDTKAIIERMVAEGHTIGVHTTSHVYKTIYASVENYLEDFNTTYNKIYEITGTYPEIFRFPGGSKNSYNKDTIGSIVKEMKARGFTYYDWNISAGDTAPKPTKESVYANAAAGLGITNRNAILLMHDTSKISASALDDVINAYKNAGFTFAPLNKNVKPIVYI